MKDKELYQRLSLLGAKWAEIETKLSLRDWAGNEWFDLTSDIDVILALLRKNHPMRKIIEKAKMITKIKGTAWYIGNCRQYGDHITPLAILAGHIEAVKWEEEWQEEEE